MPEKTVKVKRKELEVNQTSQPVKGISSRCIHKVWPEQKEKTKRYLPTSANFSTDLHSLGQFIQEGTRIMFETVVRVDKPRKNVIIPTLEEDLDGLGYLQGKDVDFVNKKATDGVLLAHTDGDVPNMYVTLPEQDAFTLGYAIYFFELAIALSGYLNAINPFDQPGVEAYKKNMFALLGKPGFEELGAELNARL